MQTAILIMSCISSFLIFYFITSFVYRDKLSVSLRLEGIQNQSNSSENSEIDQPLFSRILRPLLDNMGRAMLKITPGEMVSSLEDKIIRAGNPSRLAVKDWINMQAIVVVGLPVVTILICRSFGSSTSQMVIFLLAEVVLGLAMPGFILGKLIKKRQKVILDSLPDVIDLLTVSVEAGLGFDGALLKVIDKKPGPLAFEFDKVLQEIKVGRQKKDALKDMVMRVGLQDFTAFIGAVIQADQFGVGIANVLRIQAEQMRLKRRQRAQERAMKVPVKMLIPMVVFIFPTLFIVILGPVIIQIIENL